MKRMRPSPIRTDGRCAGPRSQTFILVHPDGRTTSVCWAASPCGARWRRRARWRL